MEIVRIVDGLISIFVRRMNFIMPLSYNKMCIKFYDSRIICVFYKWMMWHTHVLGNLEYPCVRYIQRGKEHMAVYNKIHLPSSYSLLLVCCRLVKRHDCNREEELHRKYYSCCNMIHDTI